MKTNVSGKLVGLTIAIAGLSILLTSGNSNADQKQWKKNHPRRVQVNKRLKAQNQSINNGLKNGKLTEQQAQQLHKEDRQIRQEERAMAKENGGHITKAEQKAINQQENTVRKQINQEKNPGQ